VEWGGEISAQLDKLRPILDELEDRFPGEEPDGLQK